MNKIFKVKRNSAGQSVVCSEIAKSRTKGRVVAAALAVVGLMSMSAYANELLTDTGSSTTGDGITGNFVLNTSNNYKFIEIKEVDKRNIPPIRDNSVVLGNSSVVADTSDIKMTKGIVVLSGDMLSDKKQGLSAGLSIGVDGKSQEEYYKSLPAQNHNFIAISGTISDRGGIAIGTNSSAYMGMAIGGGATAFHKNSVAIGDRSKASSDSVAIGTRANSSHIKSIALGVDSITTADSQVSVGNDTLKRKIVNIAAGDESANSTDAVNGSQLFAVKQSVSDLEGKINNLPKESTKVKKGDGVTVTQKTDGDVTTYTVAVDENVIATKDYVKNHVTTEIGKIQTKIQESIGDANEKYVDDEIGKLNNKLSTQISEKANQSDLTELDKRVGGVEKQLESKADQGYVVDELAKKANKDDLEKLEGKINTSIQADLKDKADRIEVENLLKGKVDQTAQVIVDGEQDMKINDLTAVSVTYDDTVKDTITLAGAEGTTITNVADGKVAAGSKDAVNGGQMAAFTSDIYSKISSTNERLDRVDREAKAGIASAMAFEQAPMVPGKWTYAVGMAHYGGEQAAAVSFKKTADNGRWAFTGGISHATEGEAGFRVGISGVID